MKIPHAHNLTIQRLHYYNHGPGRHRLPTVRCCEAANAGGAGHHAHACDRMRLVPAVEGRSVLGPRRDAVDAWANCWKPQVWPYDTPLPVGLPRLDPAQALVHAIEVQSRQRPRPYAPPSFLTVGRHLDLYI